MDHVHQGAEERVVQAEGPASAGVEAEHVASQGTAGRVAGTERIVRGNREPGVCRESQKPHLPSPVSSRKTPKGSQGVLEGGQVVEDDGYWPGCRTDTG